LAGQVEGGQAPQKGFSGRHPGVTRGRTGQGRALWPGVVGRGRWGGRGRAPDGPPLELVHTQCGHVAELVPVCAHCGERVGPTDVAVAGEHGSPAPKR